MAEARVSSPTPLTPPQSEEDRLNWLRLLRSRKVGVTTFFRLMQEHGEREGRAGSIAGNGARGGRRKLRRLPLWKC